MKNDRPEFVPSLEKLGGAVAAYTAAVNEAANGDRKKLQERKRVRAEVEVATAAVGNYIMMKTSHPKDLSLLLSTGFDLKPEPVAGDADTQTPFDLSAPEPAYRPSSREATFEELNMKIEIFEGGNGQYYFHIKSANGEKIAQSEGYIKKQSAVDTIAALKRELASATVVEIP